MHLAELPWVGAHFRFDALAAFVLAVGIWAAPARSLFAIGCYGMQRGSAGRVLPFYAAFLAGMTWVLADDAFPFMGSWEFMSRSYWRGDAQPS